MAASRKRKPGVHKKDRPPAPRLYADGRHIWYLGISILLLLLALAFLPTVIEQIRLIQPPGSNARTARAMREHQRTIAQDRPTAALRGALIERQRGSLTSERLAAYRRLDPGNGLYDYLEAVLALDSDAIDQGKIIPRSLLVSLKRAPPADLHHARYRKVTREALAKSQLDPRQIEAMFFVRHVWVAPLAPEGPVLREMSKAFLDLAREYRQAGRDEDAVLLEDSVGRLALDLVDHDPSPEQALLAADILAAWAESLLERGETRESLQVIEDARSLRARWHASATGEEVNLLPCTISAVWAPQVHQKVLSSLVAGVVSVAGCLVLIVLLIALAVASRFVTCGSEKNPAWPSRWRGRAWLAAVGAAAPIFLGASGILVGHVTWTWVVSSPTLWRVWVLPVVFAVWALLVAWSVMSPPLQRRESRWRWLLWTPGLVFVVVVVFDQWVRPMASGAGLPPVGIQRFRVMSADLGIVAIPVLLAGGVLLYGAHKSAAAAAAIRGGWAATVRALLILATVSLILLIWNRVQDAAHRRAFMAAMEHPIASRLGQDWRDRHFGTARVLWQDRQSES